MKIEINLKNKQTFFAVALIAIFAVVGIVIAITAVDPGHTSDDVMVSIGGVEKTLQEAIDERYFKGSLDCKFIESLNSESADCPAGYTVVGGGYTDASSQDDDTDADKPKSDLTGWQVTDEGTTHTYAVCCKIS